jgi:site-specific DNA-methyltransferase (adenine-specific)
MGPRRRTATSNFGVGRREAHDSRPFYSRFEPPDLSDDQAVAAPEPVTEPFVCGDARQMDTVKDGTVALVVTSPPYFAGKQYEEELDREGVPSSYLDYLAMLEDVFAECVRALEPGGRIAVNVANLGRKPYRSLAADVMGILQDRLHLLPRGEVVWQKGEGANGSCAWGSFRSAANPVLRDTTERVLVASKGRFARALDVPTRRRLGLPHRSTLTGDEFMAATLDRWVIAPESARRVGHPAPFPVALPARLIQLYTFVDDRVLDPFMGAGSTLVAAAGLGRRYVGYDLDESYVQLARQRVASFTSEERDPPNEAEARAQCTGETAQVLAGEALAEAGFTVSARDVRVRGTGLTVPYVATDDAGRSWYVDVAAAYTTTPAGLQRTEAVWGALGRAAALVATGHRPVLLLTSHLPKRPGDGDAALRAAGPEHLYDVVALGSAEDAGRLRTYASGGVTTPLPGFWSPADLDDKR